MEVEPSGITIKLTTQEARMLIRVFDEYTDDETDDTPGGYEFVRALRNNMLDAANKSRPMLRGEVYGGS